MEIKNNPEIKELGGKTVAYVPFKGNYLNNSKVFKDLIEKLYEWAGPKGLITPDSILLSSYQDDCKITPPDELKLEVCMTIKADVEVEGDIKKKVLPGGKYVVMRAELKGAEEYGPAWDKLVEWIKENNLEIDLSRPSYEIYLNNPEEHPEKHHIVDICRSVK